MEDKKVLIYEDNEEDMQDMRNTNYVNNNNNNNNYKTEIQDFLDKETSEPDITYFLSSDPESKEGAEVLRKCINYFFEKKWEALINYLEIGVKIDETNFNTYDSNNNLYSQIQKVKFVRDYYMGIALFKLGRYQEARSYFRQALEIYDFPQLNYNIGLCNYKLDNIDDARFYFEKVIEVDKYFFYAHYNLIKIYLLKNNINDAYIIYKSFSDSIKKEEENERIMKESQTKYEPRITSTTSNTLKLFYKLGAECYFAKGNYQDCVPIILEALKFNPDDPEVWCIYAKIFIVKKSFEYAKPLLKKALELDPNYKEARDLLNILEKKREK